MIIKDGVDSHRVSIPVTCGMCTHFDKGPMAFDKLCCQLGKKTHSPACGKFTVDLSQLRGLKEEHFAMLSAISASASDKQLALWSLAMKEASSTRKSGLHMGQTVVFSVGGDYLACYMRGYVYSIDRATGAVYIVSSLEKMNRSHCALTLMRKSVYTLDEFWKVRKKLIAEGRVAEPKPRVGSQKKTLLQHLRMSPEERAAYREQLATNPGEYVPPTIDTVPSAWLDGRVLESVEPKRIAAKIRKAKKQGVITNEGYKVQRYSANSTGKGGRKPTGRK